MYRLITLLFLASGQIFFAACEDCPNDDCDEVTRIIFLLRNQGGEDLRAVFYRTGQTGVITEEFDVAVNTTEVMIDLLTPTPVGPLSAFPAELPGGRGVYDSVRLETQLTELTLPWSSCTVMLNPLCIGNYREESDDNARTFVFTFPN